MRIFQNTLLVLLSVLLSVILAEIATRVILPQNIKGSQTVIGPFGAVFNKSSGTARHTWDERDVTYRFFQPHLRGTELNQSYKKRVLVLGDSFTFGWLLEHKDTFVGLLQSKTERAFGPKSIQFLNAASPGKGLAEHLVYLRSYGEELKPDIVLYFMNAQDTGRTLRRSIYRLNTLGELEQFDRSDRKVKFIKDVFSRFPFYQWVTDYSHLYQLARNIVSGGLNIGVIDEENRGRFRVDHSGAQRENIDRDKLAQEILRQIKIWTDTRGASFITLTTGVPLIYDSWTTHFFSEENIPFIDINPTIGNKITNEPSEFNIPGDGHPNEDGANLIAESIWPQLKPILERVLTDCQNRNLQCDK